MLKPYNKAQIHFKKIDDIGQEGRNSEVFTAHDYQLDAIIVIKEVKKERFNDADEFFEESRILYKSSHPNVVQICYACEDDDNIYLAMPYYKNGSLKKIINERFLCKSSKPSGQLAGFSMREFCLY